MLIKDSKSISIDKNFSTFQLISNLEMYAEEDFSQFPFMFISYSLAPHFLVIIIFIINKIGSHFKQSYYKWL